VVEECPVLSIETERNMFGTKQIAAVHTPFGKIKTQCVVNCAGEIRTSELLICYKNNVIMINIINNVISKLKNCYKRNIF
jgi:hypothetical protein